MRGTGIRVCSDRHARRHPHSTTDLVRVPHTGATGLVVVAGEVLLVKVPTTGRVVDSFGAWGDAVEKMNSAKLNAKCDGTEGLRWNSPNTAQARLGLEKQRGRDVEFVVNHEGSVQQLPPGCAFHISSRFLPPDATSPSRGSFLHFQDTCRPPAGSSSILLLAHACLRLPMPGYTHHLDPRYLHIITLTMPVCTCIGIYILHLQPHDHHNHLVASVDERYRPRCDYH